MSKELTEKERQNLAITFNHAVLESLKNVRTNFLTLAAAMKEVRDKKFYLELNYDNFEQYCWSPEISMKPSTINGYIRLYENLVLKKEIEVDRLKNIAISKLNMIQSAKNPEEWIDEARESALSDLRKKFLKKEKGIELEDNEIQNYIKNQKEEVKPEEKPDTPKCKTCGTELICPYCAGQEGSL